MQKLLVRGVEVVGWNLRLRYSVAGEHSLEWEQAEPLDWRLAERARVELRWGGSPLFCGNIIARQRQYNRSISYQAVGYRGHTRRRPLIQLPAAETALGLILALADSSPYLGPVQVRGFSERFAAEVSVVPQGQYLEEVLTEICGQAGLRWWIEPQTGQLVVADLSSLGSLDTIDLSRLCPREIERVAIQRTAASVTRVVVLGYQGQIQECDYPQELTTITRRALGAGSQEREFPLLPTTNRIGGAQIEAVVAGCQLVRIAGTGVPGFSGDGGPAIAAQIDGLQACCFGPGGEIYLAANNRIRKIDPVTGIITTIAGTGIFGSWGGVPGPALTIDLGGCFSLSVDPANTGLLICDYFGQRIYRLDFASGTLAVFAGTGSGLPYDGSSSGPPDTIDIGAPLQVAWDGSDCYLAVRETAFGSVSWLLRVSGGVLSYYSGGGTTPGDGGPAAAAKLYELLGIAVFGGNLYLAEQHTVLSGGTNRPRLRRINLTSTIITTVAGGFGGVYAESAAAALGTDTAAIGFGNAYLLWAGAQGVYWQNYLTGQLHAFAPATAEAWAVNTPNYWGADYSDGPLRERTIDSVWSVSPIGVLSGAPAILRRALCTDWEPALWSRTLHSASITGDLDPFLAEQSVFIVGADSVVPTPPTRSGVGSRAVDFGDHSPGSPLYLRIANILLSNTAGTTADLAATVEVRIGGAAYYSLSTTLTPGSNYTASNILVDISTIPRSPLTVEVDILGISTGDLTSYQWIIQIEHIQFLTR